MFQYRRALRFRQVGSVTVDVPFRIGSTFDTSRVFAIQAQLGSESHTAYGTKASSNQRLGFSGFFVNENNYTVLPSQTTPDYGPWILSTGVRHRIKSVVYRFACRGDLSIWKQSYRLGTGCGIRHDPNGGNFGTTCLQVLINSITSCRMGLSPCKFRQHSL